MLTRLRGVYIDVYKIRLAKPRAAVKPLAPKKSNRPPVLAQTVAKPIA